MKRILSFFAGLAPFSKTLIYYGVHFSLVLTLAAVSAFLKTAGLLYYVTQTARALLSQAVSVFALVMGFAVGADHLIKSEKI